MTHTTAPTSPAQPEPVALGYASVVARDPTTDDLVASLLRRSDGSYLFTDWSTGFIAELTGAAAATVFDALQRDHLRLHLQVV